MTVGFFLLVAVFVCALAWLTLRAWPKWQDVQEKRRLEMIAEQEKTRMHLADILKQRGAEAADDIAREREFAALQQRALVDGLGSRIGGVDEKVTQVQGITRELSAKVLEVHSRVTGIHEVVRVMASKSGLAVMAFILAGSLAAGLAFATSRAQHTQRYDRPECNNVTCVRPEYCCQTDVCCRNAVDLQVPVLMTRARPHPSFRSLL